MSWLYGTNSLKLLKNVSNRLHLFLAKEETIECYTGYEAKSEIVSDRSWTYKKCNSFLGQRCFRAEGRIEFYQLFESEYVVTIAQLLRTREREMDLHVSTQQPFPQVIAVT